MATAPAKPPKTPKRTSDQILIEIDDYLRSALREANTEAAKHELATGVLRPEYQYENGRRNMAQDIYRRVRTIVTGEAD